MGNCAGSTSSYRIVAVEGAQAEPVSWIGKNEAQHHDAVEWGPPGKPSARELRRRYPNAALNLAQGARAFDLEAAVVVGRGKFGEVRAARSRVDGKWYALKAIAKESICERRNVDKVDAEIETLVAHHAHPFLCHCFGMWQDAGHVTLVLEYLAGGELFNRMRRHGALSGGRGLPDAEARFYAAEIALALRHLHAARIVYKDLKPENILLDERGHVRLVDFGFAVRLSHERELIVGAHCGTAMCVNRRAPPPVQSFASRTRIIS
jgi:protein kinase A